MEYPIYVTIDVIGAYANSGYWSVSEIISLIAIILTPLTGISTALIINYFNSDREKKSNEHKREMAILEQKYNLEKGLYNEHYKNVLELMGAYFEALSTRSPHYMLPEKPEGYNVDAGANEFRHEMSRIKVLHGKISITVEDGISHSLNLLKILDSSKQCAFELRKAIINYEAVDCKEGITKSPSTGENEVFKLMDREGINKLRLERLDFFNSKLEELDSIRANLATEIRKYLAAKKKTILQ